MLVNILLSVDNLTEMRVLIRYELIYEDLSTIYPIIDLIKLKLP